MIGFSKNSSSYHLAFFSDLAMFVCSFCGFPSFMALYIYRTSYLSRQYMYIYYIYTHLVLNVLNQARGPN